MLQFVVASALIAAAAGYGNTNNNALFASGGYRQAGGFDQQTLFANRKVNTFGASTQGYGGAAYGANRVAVQPVSGGFASLFGGYGGVSQNVGVASQGALLGASRGSFGAIQTGAPQTVQAAIQTTHNVQFRDVESSGSVNPITVEVGAQAIPVTLLFRSASSSLNVQQAHDGAQGSTQETSSEDEPHILKHSVTKPVIQELREIITPFRKITQEIQPVQEQVLTIVSRNQGNAHASGAGLATAGVSGVNTGFVSNAGSTGSSFGGNAGSSYGSLNGGSNLASFGSSVGNYVARPSQTASFGSTGSYGGSSGSFGSSSGSFGGSSGSFGGSSGYSKGFSGFGNFGSKLSGGVSSSRSVQSRQEY